MTPARYLADTSVLARLASSAVDELVSLAGADSCDQHRHRVGDRLTVLHYDADFDLIAEITGQPTEWVVPRGSIP